MAILTALNDIVRKDSSQKPYTVKKGYVFRCDVKEARQYDGLKAARGATKGEEKAYLDANEGRSQTDELAVKAPRATAKVKGTEVVGDGKSKAAGVGAGDPVASKKGNK